MEFELRCKIEIENWNFFRAPCVKRTRFTAELTPIPQLVNFIAILDSPFFDSAFYVAAVPTGSSRSALRKPSVGRCACGTCISKQPFSNRNEPLTASQTVKNSGFQIAKQPKTALSIPERTEEEGRAERNTRLLQKAVEQDFLNGGNSTPVRAQSSFSTT